MFNVPKTRQMGPCRKTQRSVSVNVDVVVIYDISYDHGLT